LFSMALSFISPHTRLAFLVQYSLHE